MRTAKVRPKPLVSARRYPALKSYFFNADICKCYSVPVVPFMPEQKKLSYPHFQAVAYYRKFRSVKAEGKSAPQPNQHEHGMVRFKYQKEKQKTRIWQKRFSGDGVATKLMY